MVAREGHYYSNPFKDRQEVNHGYPLSPTIFNMVVDAVIWYWVTLVTGEEEGPNGFGWATQWMAAFFYANDGLLTLPRTDRLQAVLEFLSGLLNRVDLHTNI